MDLFSVYIYDLTQSNTILGEIEGTEGTSMVLCAIFVALYSDLYRRDQCLKLSGLYGLLCLAFALYIFIFTNTTTANNTNDSNAKDYLNYFILVGLFGLFEALNSANIESILAESIPKGERSLIFTIKYMIQMAAMSIGPLIMYIMFIFYSNVWSNYDERIIIITGVCISIISMFFLFFFNDDYCIDNHNQSIERSSLNEIHMIKNIQHEDDDLNQSTSSSIIEQYQLFGFITIKRSYLPYILISTDVWISIGAGMTVKFFPVFFYNEFNVSPEYLSFLYVCNPLCTAFFAYLMQKLSLQFGRMNIILISRALGISCLLGMVFLNNVTIVAIIWVLRYAFMNSIAPLRRSILMDVVSKKRSKWNSVESLAQFSWSGSAFLGGYLIDTLSYKDCFFITAMIYIVGNIFFSLVYPFVPAETYQPKNNTQNGFGSKKQIFYQCFSM